MDDLDYQTIRATLMSLNSKEKEEAIRALQDIIDEQCVEIATEECEEIVCPHCDSNEIVKYGTGRNGKQRYQCKACGKTFSATRTGNVLTRSKLTKDKWYKFCYCYVNMLPLRAAAAECDVSLPTSFFMRRRMLELVAKIIPSFEVKEGIRVEMDEMYLPESFKGNRSRSKFRMPRKSRKNGNAAKKRGLSNEQIAIMTSISDNDDIFFQVACRGGISTEVVENVLKTSISSGSIIATDKNRAYPSALRKLGKICHQSFDSKKHKGLGHVNALHGKIRGFLKVFKGVSTKWLSQYLAWFKWLDSFRGVTSKKVSVALGNIISGSYDTTRRGLRDVPFPFRDLMGKEVKFRTIRTGFLM